MQATADSRIVRIKGAINLIVAAVALIDIKEFPSRVISKCPAIKLAVNRTHSVIGRIKLLVISIKTINDIRAPGVP
jgi:hypothetical protein